MELEEKESVIQISKTMAMFGDLERIILSTSIIVSCVHCFNDKTSWQWL